jgi:alkanesulfonate monooxygenase
MKATDSSWHKQLATEARKPESDDSPYWLVPFQNYKTFCPYLVGSYERVADEVRRYMNVGYRNFILDVPPSPAELKHIGEVFALAQNRTR